MTPSSTPTPAPTPIPSPTTVAAASCSARVPFSADGLPVPPGDAVTAAFTAHATFARIIAPAAETGTAVASVVPSIAERSVAASRIPRRPACSAVASGISRRLAGLAAASGIHRRSAGLASAFGIPSIAEGPAAASGIPKIATADDAAASVSPHAAPPLRPVTAETTATAAPWSIPTHDARLFAVCAEAAAAVVGKLCALATLVFLPGTVARTALAPFLVGVTLAFLLDKLPAAINPRTAIPLVILLQVVRVPITAAVHPRAATAPINPPCRPRTAATLFNPRVALPFFAPLNAIPTVAAAAAVLPPHAAEAATPFLPHPRQPFLIGFRVSASATAAPVRWLLPHKQLLVVDIQVSTVAAAATVLPRAVASSVDRWRRRRSTRQRARLRLPLASAPVAVAAPISQRRTTVVSPSVAPVPAVFFVAVPIVFAFDIVAALAVFPPAHPTLPAVGIAGVGFSAGRGAVDALVTTAGTAVAIGFTVVVNPCLPWRSRTRAILSITNAFGSVPAAGVLFTRAQACGAIGRVPAWRATTIACVLSDAGLPTTVAAVINTTNTCTSTSTKNSTNTSKTTKTITTTTNEANAGNVGSREEPVTPCASRREPRLEVPGGLRPDHGVGFPRASPPTPAFTTLEFPVLALHKHNFPFLSTGTNGTGLDAGDAIARHPGVPRASISTRRQQQGRYLHVSHFSPCVYLRESRREARSAVSGGFLWDHGVGFPRASAPTPVFTPFDFLILALSTHDSPSLSTRTTRSGLDAGDVIASHP